MATRNFTRLGGERQRPSPQFLTQPEAAVTATVEAAAVETPATTSQTSQSNPAPKQRKTKEAAK